MDKPVLPYSLSYATNHISLVELMRDEQIKYNILMNNILASIDKKHHFTPALEDIHIGYECEANMYKFHSELNDEWHPCIFKAIPEYIFEYRDKNVYRTPYLTCEAIIKEGWSIINEDIADLHKYFIRGLYKINYLPYQMYNLNGYIKIYRVTGKLDENVYTLFDGICDDINTFRKIIKLLNIN